VTGDRFRIDLFVSPFEKSELGIERDIEDTLEENIG
jgi:hypothetical protein